jgi:hypothetical protein
MKLCFNNFAGPEWDTLLEEKASIILATVASSLPKSSVCLDLVNSTNGRKPDYRCRVMIAVDDHYHEWCRSTHRKAELAVEAALLRLRRQAIRQSLPTRRHILRSGWIS